MFQTGKKFRKKIRLITNSAPKRKLQKNLNTCQLYFILEHNTNATQRVTCVKTIQTTEITAKEWQKFRLI